MKINFSYEGKTNHLTKSEIQELRYLLKPRVSNFDNEFYARYLKKSVRVDVRINARAIKISGWYDDYYPDYFTADIEHLLSSYEIDWTGGCGH